MLTPDVMLAAYGQGIFPMAESRDSAELFWVNPERRGVFPIGGFRISRSLARTLRSGRFTASIDRDFAGVVAGCADRAETWINPELTAIYAALHRRGDAHSVEIWEGEALIGGVFGLVLGAAFFGESMFSRRPDGSKMALAVLHDRLQRDGFRLFDTQFLTPHLASLGAVEVSRSAYLRQLAGAVSTPAQIGSSGAAYSAGASSTGSSAGERFSTGSVFEQRSTQTS